MKTRSVFTALVSSLLSLGLVWMLTSILTSGTSIALAQASTGVIRVEDNSPDHALSTTITATPPALAQRPEMSDSYHIDLRPHISRSDWAALKQNKSKSIAAPAAPALLLPDAITVLTEGF
jgi:hypothetical protein